MPHPGTREYRNQAIRIMDLTVNTDMLKDLRFENCQICGPAVLILLSGSTVQNCSFGGSDLNEIFWLEASVLSAEPTGTMNTLAWKRYEALADMAPY